MLKKFVATVLAVMALISLTSASALAANLDDSPLWASEADIYDEINNSNTSPDLRMVRLDNTLVNTNGVVINGLYYSYDKNCFDNRDTLHLEVINNRSEDISITAEIFLNKKKMYEETLSSTPAGTMPNFVFPSSTVNSNCDITLNMEYINMFGANKLYSIKIGFHITDSDGKEIFKSSLVSIPVVREDTIKFNSVPIKQTLIDEPELQFEILGYQAIENTSSVWLYYRYTNKTAMDIKSGDVELVVNGTREPYYLSIDFEANTVGTGVIYVDRSIEEMDELILYMELTNGFASYEFEIFFTGMNYAEKSSKSSNASVLEKKPFHSNLSFEDMLLRNGYVDDVAGFTTSDGTLFVWMEDGTVEVLGCDYSWSDEIERWTDIVDIKARWTGAIGLKSDGTVVAVGSKNNNNQFNVESWRDIVQIEATSEHSFGLKRDGTVVESGDYAWTIMSYPSEWRNIVSLTTATLGNVQYLFGLTKDGRVFRPYQGIIWNREPQDVISIASSGWVHLALKDDGTVFFAGEDAEYYGDELKQWTDVVSIHPGDMFAAGLKSDGTVVTADADDWHSTLSIWKDVEILYVSQSNIVIGVCKDRSVWVCSPNDSFFGEFPEWHDIQKLDTFVLDNGSIGAVGLRSDGRLLVLDLEIY